MFHQAQQKSSSSEDCFAYVTNNTVDIQMPVMHVEIIIELIRKVVKVCVKIPDIRRAVLVFSFLMTPLLLKWKKKKRFTHNHDFFEQQMYNWNIILFRSFENHRGPIKPNFRETGNNP